MNIWTVKCFSAMSSSSLHFRSLEAEEIVGDEAVDEAAPTFNEEVSFQLHRLTV